MIAVGASLFGTTARGFEISSAEMANSTISQILNGQDNGPALLLAGSVRLIRLI